MMKNKEEKFDPIRRYFVHEPLSQNFCHTLVCAQSHEFFYKFMPALIETPLGETANAANGSHSTWTHSSFLLIF